MLFSKEIASVVTLAFGCLGCFGAVDELILKEEFYSDGALHRISSFNSKGQKHGWQLEYWQNGNLKWKSDCEYGSPGTYSATYHENGQIQAEVTRKWVKGRYKMWDENGRLLEDEEEK